MTTSDMFTKLARLERNCEVRFSSVYAGERLAGWRVVISCRGSAGAAPVVAERASLLLAVSDALAAAEALGWIAAEERER